MAVFWFLSMAYVQLQEQITATLKPNNTALLLL